MLLRVVYNHVPDAAAVAVLRWRMVRKLGDHCGREDHIVYEPLMASDDAAAQAIARCYREEHGRLLPDFSSYIAAWPVERVASEWESFRAETEAVVMRLHRRIFLEEQILYAHVERVAAKRRAA